MVFLWFFVVFLPLRGLKFGPFTVLGRVVSVCVWGRGGGGRSRPRALEGTIGGRVR